MSALTLAGIGLLGGVGALGRFLLDGAVASRLGRGFPYGTLAVNLSGSLALGVLVGAAVSDDALRLAGTGLVGAYTTFSTWALESHRLGEDGRLPLGAFNFAASLYWASPWLGRRSAGAMGATSVRGIWGYHGDHRPHGDSFWQLQRRVPVVTVVIDTPPAIRRWFEIVDELTDETGLVTSEIVPAFRARAPERDTGGLRLATDWSPPP